MQHDKAPLRRCAIYIRKSSEEGLEQDFNSLHAQREACESFIKSQQGEGWRFTRTAYDDGGLSGGTMSALGCSACCRISASARWTWSFTRLTGLLARSPTSPGWSRSSMLTACHLLL
jgi:hypothetical protein